MNLAIFYEDAPGTIGGYFLSALRSLGHQVDRFDTRRADDCPGGYEVYLRIDHGDYTHDLPRQFRPRAFYVVDTHLRRSWVSIRHQARGYDLVLCAQREAARRLPRAEWVPLACDPDIHTAPETLPRRYDLAFVGNDGGVPRKFYLQELMERYPNSFIGKAPHTEMAAIYRQAKIAFHYIECTSPLKDHVSMRVYEVLATGTLLLANTLAPGAFDAVGLHDRRDLVLYRSPRELLECIAYYLRHEEKREQIAAAGRACILQQHTYRHRAERIIHLMQRQLGV